METEFTMLDGDALLCPSCGQPMQFVSAIPRFAALPELRTYECKACGETYTEAVEPGERSDVAWMNAGKMAVWLSSIGPSLTRAPHCASARRSASQ